MKKTTNYNKRSLTNNQGLKDTTKKGFLIILCIVLFMGFMYFLTTRILQKKQMGAKDTPVESVIQYDKILAGEVFDQKDDDYYVVFYDSDDEYSTLASYISSYQSKNDVTRLYSVDLHDGMNAKYVTEEVVVADNIAVLKVKAPTLLHFKDHRVVEVITDESAIHDFFTK